MSSRQSIEVFDRMLRDINDYEPLFSEKVIVFDGIFVKSC